MSLQEVTGTDDTSEASSTPHAIKQTFIAISAVSNPILYLINDRFRAGILRLVTCGKYRGAAIASLEQSDTATYTTNQTKASQ